MFGGWTMPAYFFRSEPGAAELRRLARRESGRVCQRVLMIANMLEGMEHEEAARLAGLSRSAAYEWHNRYEEDGIEGLRDRPRPGRQPRVDAVTSARFKERIVAGAELERDGVVAFRGVDAQRILKEEFEIDCSLSSTYRLLHRIKLSWLAPRPRHPRGRCDGASGVFATVGLQLERVRAAQARGTRVEVWFQDEARIGQKNSLTRVWGQTGSRPAAPKDLGFASAYVFGAVCPSEGKAAALIMPICNTAAMNHHLCEISSQVAADAHAVVILDGAGWHSSQGLVVPGNITLLALPPYSPELNPVERIWHYLRSHWLANSVFPSLADIMDACEMAWNRFATNHGLVRSLCAVAWAPASPAL